MIRGEGDEGHRRPQVGLARGSAGTLYVLKKGEKINGNHVCLCLRWEVRF